MVKINTEAFNKVNKDVALTHDVKDDNIDVVKNTPVYNIPRAWVNELKKNKMSVSSYLKQAMFEKMKRDGML